MKSLFVCLVLSLSILILPTRVCAQQNRVDSLFISGDTTRILDSLLAGFDDYLDSLYKPKSFFNFSLGMGTGIFSFEDKNSVFISTEKKLVVSPSVGYYNKTGLGITATGFMIYDKSRLNFYQAALTPSYDLIKRKFSTGISYTRYFNKDSVDFYVTPICNELYAYFTWKKAWLRPGLSISYGWGSQTDYEKQEYIIWSRLLQQSRSYFITVKNFQTVRDLSMTLSVRKDIKWWDVFSKADEVVLTPVVLLNAGTQNFGFNTSYSTNQAALIRVNALPSNTNISETTDFAFQSLSAVLRGSYFKGRFLFQPQLFFDYALWDTDNRFNTVYSLMAAVSF